MPVYTFKGSKYNVPASQVVQITHDHNNPGVYSPKYILGCTRCKTFCSDRFACKCCQIPKSARPYAEGHEQLIETALFVERVTKKVA